MQHSCKRIYKTVKFGFLQYQRRIDPVLDDPVNPVIFMPDRNTPDSRFRIHIPVAFVVKNIRTTAVGLSPQLPLSNHVGHIFWALLATKCLY